MPLTGFDHVTLAVDDLEQATVAYARLLGSEPLWRGRHPGLGTQSALFGLANGLVELCAPLPADEAAYGLREWLATHGQGMQAIAFATADAGLCSADLRERGVRATPPEDGEARSDAGAEVRSYRSVQVSPRLTGGLTVLAVERPDGARLRPSATPAAEAVEAIDHIVIRTADPDAAVGLYRDGLGIRLALDRERRGTRMLFFRVGGVTIEVVQDRGLEGGDAFYGIAYRVRDIDAAHRRLSGAGFSLSEPRDGNKPGTRVFTVRDGTCGVPTLFLRDPTRDPARSGATVRD